MSEKEEIKVGDYIRIKYGYIARVVNIDDFRPPENRYVAESNLFDDVVFIGDEDIVKHSPNIIDLIEEGDYVNGRRVKLKFLDIFTKNERLELEGIEINWQGDRSTTYYDIEDIKSIVTKEQFEHIKYVMEE